MSQNMRQPERGGDAYGPNCFAIIEATCDVKFLRPLATVDEDSNEGALTQLARSQHLECDAYLPNALREAMRVLTAASTLSNRRLVLITDGVELVAHRPESYALARVAGNLGIAVDVVSLAGLHRTRVLQKIVSVSAAGRFVHLKTPAVMASHELHGYLDHVTMRTPINAVLVVTAARTMRGHFSDTRRSKLEVACAVCRMMFRYLSLDE